MVGMEMTRAVNDTDVTVGGGGRTSTEIMAKFHPSLGKGRCRPSRPFISTWGAGCGSESCPIRTPQRDASSSHARRECSSALGGLPALRLGAAWARVHALAIREAPGPSARAPQSAEFRLLA